MITRPTVLEVDTNAFKYNVRKIQEYIGNNVKIMPVIKANAYGTYINKLNDVINNFDIVAVANVDEAVELRDNGYLKEIFVLNQPYTDEIQKIIENDITVGICSNIFLDELGKLDEKVKVHIEIETGMGRTGVSLDNLKEYISKIKQNKNIKVEGIYTHFSSADYDDEYTKKQIKIFEEAVQEIQKELGNIKYIHCSASNGILNYPNKCFNLVRPGIILYGYNSFDKTMEKINLKPVCRLKSKITFLKEVPENTSISYSRTFITNRKTKVATIPIGYADGLRRCLSNKGEVLMNGKRVPIIGNVCMDGFLADVTDLNNVSVGDDVYIWDNENITLDEIADKCNTINYEIMSTISYRVPRVFI